MIWLLFREWIRAYNLRCANCSTCRNQLWAVTAMVGAALCGFVLLVIGLVALNPVSRRDLDRVSFRILVCALLANTVFGIANAVGGKFTGPTWACGFTIFLLQLTLEMSSFLLFSIALNLQLVVVHRLNGQKMEKFYIFGSILISLCLTIPPYAAKQWDPLVEDCWYSNDNQKERLAWQIGTQLFWTLLTVAGEFITTSTVVIYMLNRHRLQRAHNLNNLRTRSRSGSSTNDRVDHANVYRGVILRIVRYPIASALINLTSVACVIHATKENGVHNWTGYHVLLVSDFVYGGRAIVYALLAATDPALVRALRTFIQHTRGSTYPRETHTSGMQSTFYGTGSRTQNLSVHIELSTISKNDHGTVMDLRDGAPPKSSGTPHDYSTNFDSMLKPQSGIEEGPLDDAVAHDDTSANECRVHIQTNMAHRNQELLSKDRDREDFQKQI
ncbi:hypothetical protein B0H15DRAFT_781892 [Mycena belliarum]|uniref:G-protein coupled receptors family 2 profile 2 domain-containing protein n=1 Tax=Mycena belliarum TaxID=1033014 RepID=A0AAD6XQB2_9AGAR|nr:hypothetical protein B0H15DRAFT_781892 [Mycena belliae]